MTVKVGLISLGCAKNLVNSEQMLYQLKSAGYTVTGETDGADAVVINTCGFIESAKTEAIETILELGAKKRAGQKIIVAGCLAQRYKDEIFDEMPEVDAIVGTGSYNEIADAVRQVLDGKKPSLYGDINAQEPETGRIITTLGLWSYIKIAEGCDNRCAYCVIPSIRGRYRSRAMENVLKEAQGLVRGGIKELIIVAQDVTRYGLDLYAERRLSQLLREMCAIDGDFKLRLHYLYPDEIDDELIDVIAENDKILKYLDIPIQHISDKVLQKMRRRGTSAEIQALFKKLRARVPGLVLRTSVITGLPGEGEAEFLELCEFLKDAKIERTGVFPYSPEEGTDAFLMDRPDSDTAVLRAAQISQIQSRIIDEFNESRIGQVLCILAEGYDEGLYYGRSFAESPEIDGVIHFTGEDIIVGSFVSVRITGAVNGELYGKEVLL